MIGVIVLLVIIFGCIALSLRSQLISYRDDMATRFDGYADEWERDGFPEFAARDRRRAEAMRRKSAWQCHLYLAGDYETTKRQLDAEAEALK